jgi:hypothetical protein
LTTKDTNIRNVLLNFIFLNFIQTFGKPYGIRPRYYWEHIGNTFENLRIFWEHAGNTLPRKEKRKKKLTPPPKGKTGPIMSA